MKISVVIPNFNDLRIKRTIESVSNQTYKNFEILIVDGNSTNAELLNYYTDCGADKVMIEKDEGIFDALNKGIKNASGDVIYLLGSDDQLSDNKVFQNVINEFDKQQNLDGVCIGCEFINAANKVIRVWYPDSVSSAKIKWGIFPPHFSLFLKKDLYQVVGSFKYQEFKNIACDTVWLLDLAIAKENLKIPVLKNHHLKMEYGGASTGSTKAIARQFKVVAEYARQNASKLPAWFMLSPIRTFSKVFQLKL